MKQHTSRQLADMIENSKGKFVTVNFRKKDGSMRTLNGRIGVKKHLRGGARTTDSDKYVGIYDVKNSGYRNANRDTIVSLKIEGETLVV